MKFINPIVTESPMLMRNRRLPYASPSNSTPMKLVIMLIAVSSGCNSRGCEDLLPVLREWPRELAHHAELDDVLRRCSSRERNERRCEQPFLDPFSAFHRILLQDDHRQHGSGSRSGPILIYSCTRQVLPSICANTS